ncbi:MAG: hypothetical protein AB8B87_15905 [Granulosicoccus sp.]
MLVVCEVAAFIANLSGSFYTGKIENGAIEYGKLRADTICSVDRAMQGI